MSFSSPKSDNRLNTFIIWSLYAGAYLFAAGAGFAFGQANYVAGLPLAGLACILMTGLYARSKAVESENDMLQGFLVTEDDDEERTPTIPAPPPLGALQRSRTSSWPPAA